MTIWYFLKLSFLILYTSVCAYLAHIMYKYEIKMNEIINNLFLLILIFFANILINDENYFFLLIYLSLSLYHLYFFFVLFKIKKQDYDSKCFLFTSLLLYLTTYFIIREPNPLFYFITFYVFFPNFIKAILIIFIHSYFISFYMKNKRQSIIP